MSRIVEFDAFLTAFVDDLNHQLFSDTVHSGTCVQHDIMIGQTESKTGMKLHTGSVMMFISPEL